MSRTFPALSPTIALALVSALALAMAGCGAPSGPEPQATAPVAAEPAQDAATPAPDATGSEAAAAMDAREQEIAAKQVELELREREIAAREAAAAKPKTSSTPKAAATPKPATSAPAAAPAAPAPPPPPVTVPEGTQLSVRLNQAYSTKTTTVGEPVQASLASDLVVDGRLVANAGATLNGSVTEVVSGSQKIGAVPALKIGFTQLVLADGTTAAINARVAQKGESEKGRDTAKIVGGAAAGAIIGHQIDDDKGSVIGGVLGATGGAVAAKKTGTELDLAAGTVVPATLRQAFEYRGK
jgi:hypothetical protein